MLMTPARCREVPEIDPLRYEVDLPFQATFHPMGHPVEICTNSADAMQTAARLWKRYPVLAESTPIRLRIIGSPTDDAPLRDVRPPRGQGHLLSIVHGPQDFAVADLATGFAFAWLSEDTLSNQAYFRYYFLEPLTYVMQASRHFVFVHASCIARDGCAILLCGDSGSGKTCLAYACAKRGWEFVSGDAVHVVRGHRDRKVIGRPYEIRFRESARELFPELLVAKPERRANGNVDLEVDTSELGIPTAIQSSAGHIVFLERSNTTNMERYPPYEAMRHLKKTICFGDETSRREQHAALFYFARLPLWKLSYTDLSSAEQLLSILSGRGAQC